MEREDKIWKKIFFSLVALLPTAIFIMIVSRHFSYVYLFGWMLRNPLICLLPVLLACVVNAGGAFWVSCANVLAILSGQFFGDRIRARNIAQITSDMDAGVVARLSQHRGFYIWMVAMLVVFALFCLGNFGIWLKRKLQKTGLEK